MRLGLIVNPVAGLGGPLGLKGTDGQLTTVALATVAPSHSRQRAEIALSALRPIADRLTVVTGAGVMGGDAARNAGLRPTLVYDIADEWSQSGDTTALAKRLIAHNVDLIAFAGGDGTARDILSVVGKAVPVVGIPAGVKIHSSVFATSPRAAGDILRRHVEQTAGRPRLTLAEVLDRAEGGASHAPTLYGVMRTPADAHGFQAGKAIARLSEHQLLESACQHLARRFNDDVVTIVGPGSTMLSFKRALGVEGTLLGVDVTAGGKALALDANEATIRSLIAGRDARIVLGVVGGQGFLLGRGNQQISPAVIRAVGRDNISVIASAAKLSALPQRRLLVDSGDAALDAALAGFLPVQVSATQTLMMRLDAA